MTLKRGASSELLSTVKRPRTENRDIFSLIQAGDIDGVKSLWVCIKDIPKNNLAKGIVEAAKYGRLNIIQYLSSSKVPDSYTEEVPDHIYWDHTVTHCFNTKHKALEFALMNDHTEVAEYILNQLSPNRNEIVSANIALIKQNKLSGARFLVSKYRGFSENQIRNSLFGAISKGDLKLVKLLLSSHNDTCDDTVLDYYDVYDASSDIFDTKKYEYNQLLFAIQNNKLDIAKYLLANRQWSSETIREAQKLAKNCNDDDFLTSLNTHANIDNSNFLSFLSAVSGYLPSFLRTATPEPAVENKNPRFINDDISIRMKY